MIELTISFIYSLFAIYKNEINDKIAHFKNEVFTYLNENYELLEEYTINKNELFLDKYSKFKLSNFKSKYTTILELSNTDESIKIIKLPKRKKLNQSNDGDIYTINENDVVKAEGFYNKDAPLVFSRKSDKKQSKVELIETIENVTCCGYYLAGDSSGFDDYAILRCLAYAIKHDIKEIIVLVAKGSSRDAYATTTRNVKTAQKLVSQSRLSGIDVNINGSIFGTNGAIFLLMVTINAQSVWVSNANTTHNKKHHSYLEFLLKPAGKKLALLESMEIRAREEIEALIVKNEGQLKTIAFLKGMITRPVFTTDRNNKIKVFCTLCYNKEK